MANIITTSIEEQNQKNVLTFTETANYLGVSKSWLYKLTSQRKIPHYKPSGKMCYFNRDEVELWAFSNKVATNEELSQKAQSYSMKGGIK